MAKTSAVLWIIVSCLVVLTVAVVMNARSQSVLDDQLINAPVASTLLGKSATVSIQARDSGADDVTTRRGVPVYIVDSDGTYVETGSSSTTASGAATQFTSGMKVSDKPYKITAFNNTWGSVSGLQDVMLTSQSPNVDVSVYLMSHSLEMTLYDSDDNALARSASNLTLGAGETKAYTKLRIKNNLTNSGFNLYGLYFDLDANTNVSAIQINDAKVDVEGSMSLSSVTTDDKTWKMKTPTILYEFSQLDIGTIQVTADGDGTALDTDSFTLYAVDGAYFYSAKGKGVLFGPENDATSPADVGQANPSISGFFN